jgi:hypothetical protein
LGLKCDPVEFIHIFVDHPSQLKEFLWHVVRNETNENTVLWNTLLELCLRPDLTDLTDGGALSQTTSAATPGTAPGGGGAAGASSGGGGGGEAAAMDAAMDWSEAMQVLNDPKAKFDPDHALFLVQLHNCKEGQLRLYEKLRMYAPVHFTELPPPLPP